MATSLSTALTHLSTKLDDLNNQRWTTTELTQYLNEGQTDVVRRSETLEELVNIGIVNGIQKYLAPANMNRIHKVEFVPSGQTQTWPLQFREILTMDSIWGIYQNQPSSFSQYYSLWGQPPLTQIILYPTPGQSGHLNVWYYRRCVQLVNNTDNIDVPEGWADLAITYAEYVALRKDADPRWADAKSIYEDKLTEMIEKTRLHADAANTFDTGFSGMPWFMAADPGSW